ncbi:MAG TPA: hypothetical protein VGU64_11390 [Terriglobales bacterium]|nr:hypothetical protein [Terriglobales bacterium]
MKPLPIMFVIAFTAGLVLAVIAMLHGVEYTRPNRSRAPSPFFNLPTLAAFAVAFGAVGYPVASHTNLPTWGVLLIATASGALAISAMITLLASWALRGVAAGSADEHEIQGQLAIVTRDIDTATPGEIRYELLGREIKVPAKTLSAKPLSAGAEVVIDRIENGIAFVEEWAVVEQRI